MDEKDKKPEVRFDGFTDAWEQCKLESIADIIDPHPSHRAPKEESEGIPFIGIGDLNEIGNINYTAARIVDEKVYDEHHKRYNLSKSSIGIGRVASFDKNKAKEYFEKLENTKLPTFKINIRVHNLLLEFIINGGFGIEEWGRFA